MKTLLEAGVKIGREAVSDSDATSLLWVVEGRGELDGVPLLSVSRDGVVEYALDEVLVRSLVDLKREKTAEGLSLVSPGFFTMAMRVKTSN